MSQYTIVLLGLLAVMVTVYADDKGRCHRENESLDICGALCEPKCNIPELHTRLCPAIPCTKLTSGCRCDKGYVRDTASGSCVLRRNCPKKQGQKEQDQKEQGQKEQEQKEQDQKEQAPPRESAE